MAFGRAPIAVFLALVAGNTAARATETESRLGGVMETAFRACAMQVSRPGYLAAPNAAELSSVGIVLSEAPPEPYRAMFTEKAYGEPVFAKLTNPDSTIWLAGFQGSPVCKVVIGDTDSALGARLDVDRRFRATTSWTVVAPESQSGLFIQRFTLNASRPGPHMSMLISGPNSVKDNGRGPQALMTIAITNGGTE